MRMKRQIQLILTFWLAITAVIPGMPFSLTLQSSSVMPGGVACSASVASMGACCCPDPAKMQRRMACCPEITPTRRSQNAPTTHRPQVTSKGCLCAFAPHAPTRGPSQNEARSTHSELSQIASLPTLFVLYKEVSIPVVCHTVSLLKSVILSSLPSRAPPFFA